MNIILKPPSLHGLAQYHGASILTQARISSCRYRDTDSGKRIAQLIVEDASATLPAVVSAENLDWLDGFRLPCPAEVVARVHAFKSRVWLIIEALNPLALRSIESGAALLPRGRCPAAAHAALDRLVTFEQQLPGRLHIFLRNVLMDERIGPKLLDARASAGHHHAYKGGLLVHSTDMLEIAGTLAAQALPDEPLAGPLTQLGYLLHDLGKIRTLGAEHCPRAFIRHELVNLMLLEPHLQALSQQEPDSAAALGYILDFVATPPERRGYARFLGAEIVVFLDQLSVAVSRGRSLTSLLGDTAESTSLAANGTSFDMTRPRRKVRGARLK